MVEKTNAEIQKQETQELIVFDGQGQLNCTPTENDYLSLPWVEQTKNGQIRCVHQILCDYMREHFNLMNTDKALCIYHNGCYQALSKKLWIAMLKNCFPSRYRQERDWERAYKELRTDTPVPKDRLNPNEDIVNFQNGLLNIRTMELLPHTPEYLSTIQIPCNYMTDVTFKDCPVFYKYINDLTLYSGFECKTLLFEFFGAVISNVDVIHFKKLLILTGDGDTGKSKYRELLTYIVGDENNATIDLKDLNSNFGTGHLIDKRLAGCGDMSDISIDSMSILKQLTGGDSVQATVKYKMGENMKYKGFLLFVCNKLPLFQGDKGSHVYERFMIVPCTNVIPPEEQDENILEKMKAETDAIVSISMRYLHKVIVRGYKFTEGSVVQDMRKQYEIQNNSALLFITENCEIGVGRTLCSNFYEQYTRWCKENKYIAESKQTVTKILKENFGITSKKSSLWYYELTIKHNW